MTAPLFHGLIPFAPEGWPDDEPLLLLKDVRILVKRLEAEARSEGHMEGYLSRAEDEHMMAEAAAAAPALDWHASVKWEQDRDDPVGMWRCACGATFAPDDLDGYQRHLPRLAIVAIEAEAGATSVVPGLDVARLAAIGHVRFDPTSNPATIAVRLDWHGIDYRHFAAEYARLADDDEEGGAT